jgi:hypothetical protein
MVKPDTYYNLKFAKPNKDTRLSQQNTNSEIKMEVLYSKTFFLDNSFYSLEEYYNCNENVFS